MSTVTKISHTTAIWGKWMSVTLILGILAFLASPNAPMGGFWGGPVEHAAPAGFQILGFITLGIIQSLAFGLGIAFLLFGFPLLSSGKLVNQRLGHAAHLAITWSLVSWWPHTSFHQTVNPDNLNALLAIEYGFHVTLVLAGLIIAFFFVTLLQHE